MQTRKMQIAVRRQHADVLSRTAYSQRMTQCFVKKVQDFRFSQEFVFVFALIDDLINDPSGSVRDFEGSIQ